MNLLGVSFFCSFGRHWLRQCGSGIRSSKMADQPRGRRRQSQWRPKKGLALLALLLWSAIPIVAHAQPGPPPDEPPLLEREPYDIMVLPDKKGNPMEVRIEPLTDGRSGLEDKKTYKVRVVWPESPFPNREIDWRNEYVYKSWLTLVMEEADRLVKDKQYELAYEYLQYLHRIDPELPGLKQKELEYLYVETARLFQVGQYAESLAVLEELRARDPNFRLTPTSPDQLSVMRNVLDKALGALFDRRSFDRVRETIADYAKRYPGELDAALNKWRGALRSEAQKLYAEAQSLADQEKIREARRTARQALSVDPDFVEAISLLNQIHERFRLTLVGVTQPALVDDQTQVDNWASRRVSRLTQRYLMQFTGFGAEGGDYRCDLATRQLSDDALEWSLRIRPGSENVTGIGDAYALYDMLSSAADPDSPIYEPAWARLVEAFEIRDPNQLVVRFRRMHVLPESLVQIPFESNGDQDAVREPFKGMGDYSMVQNQGGEMRFAHKPPRFAGDPQVATEVGEILYVDAEDAIEALLEGEIDILDRVPPARAAELESHPDVRVGEYDIPTVHMLVCNDRNPYMQNPMFRRALVYGINRQATLDQVVLGGRPRPGCRVLSGPFPAEVAGASAIAYAYDERLEPKAYDPRLAFTLKELAMQTVSAPFRSEGKEPPSLGKLVLAYPDQPLARQVAATIAEQLDSVQIPIEIRALPLGMTDDPTDDFDLLLVEAALWEPLVDAERLLSKEHGLARIGSPYVDLALRQVDGARTWNEARLALRDLHHYVDQEVTIIPLWQLIERYAYRVDVQGVPSRQFTLYQNVDDWSVEARASRPSESAPSATAAASSVPATSASRAP